MLADKNKDLKRPQNTIFSTLSTAINKSPALAAFVVAAGKTQYAAILFCLFLSALI
jgi:hypothetical protein